MSKIILEDVRGSYIYVTKQRKNDKGEDAGWGMQVLINKNHPQLRRFQGLVKKVLEEAVGTDAAKKKGKYKLPIRDGDEERDGEEYEGMYFFNANSKSKKPGIVNKAGEPADQDDLEEYCYSGAYYHVSVSLYYFPSRDGGKPGVAVGLNNIMLRKKGDRLDGTSSAKSDFSKYAETDVNDNNGSIEDW